MLLARNLWNECPAVGLSTLKSYMTKDSYTPCHFKKTFYWKTIHRLSDLLFLNLLQKVDINRKADVKVLLLESNIILIFDIKENE